LAEQRIGSFERKVCNGFVGTSILCYW
jgi:hypothetical protein